MIQKYLYGVPFATESVVAPIPASQGEPPVGTVKISESGFCFACPLAEGDRAAAFGALDRELPRDGAEVAVAILEPTGVPWAWAGRHRLSRYGGRR